MHKTVLICGSLRQASYHAGILRAFVEQKDPRFQFEWLRIDNFPFFNEDIEAKGNPLCVQRARNVVSKCNAVLFGVPEYLHTVPGVLKNAMDWLERKDKNNYCPLINKPCAMVSAGYSMRGGRSQKHFTEVLECKKMKVLKPSQNAQFLISLQNNNKFDSNGNLIDQQLKNRVKIFLNQFNDFILIHQK